jgi:two-component system KDP operon response regulator KdpE
MLSMLLTSTSPEIMIANSGQLGIDLARQQNPDIIILDLMMPEINGWQVCQEVRKFSDVPILILTSVDTSGMIIKALDAGADDYLIKPVSGNILVAHLNNLLRRTKMPVQVNYYQQK